MVQVVMPLAPQPGQRGDCYMVKGAPCSNLAPLSSEQQQDEAVIR
jgi:hypothetical protein